MNGVLERKGVYDKLSKIAVLTLIVVDNAILSAARTTLIFSLDAQRVLRRLEETHCERGATCSSAPLKDTPAHTHQMALAADFAKLPEGRSRRRL